MRHFYKVISHSASAYGGEDEAAAKAVFTHQKKLIEDGHTQAHQVFLYKDGAVIDSHTLEEDEKPNPRFVANASRQQFLDEVHHGAANGVSVSGAFLSTTIEDEYQLWLIQKAEPESEFTQAEQSALDSLRSRGFAVVIFTPSELENMDDTVSVDDLESRMIQVGNDFIDEHEKEEGENEQAS